MPRHTGVLIDLIQKEQIKIFAEIGISCGKNLKKILRSESTKIIEEYWAVDPWHPVPPPGPPPLFVDRFFLYEEMCQAMVHFKQLRVLRMFSVVAAKLFPNGYFNMVYIDADHSYSAVAQDIEAWLPKVKIGGLLGGHDYNMATVRKAVDELLPNAWEPPPAPRGSTKVWLFRRV